MSGAPLFCTVVIPVLNDPQALKNLLTRLQPLRLKNYEIIVVDGGSEIKLSADEQLLLDHYVFSRPGRAGQMNAGARLARGQLLWFLHADSMLNPGLMHEALQRLQISGRCWGRFDVRLSGNDRRLNVVAFFMNWRSALTGVVTGDQGIFVEKKVFEQAGAYPDIPIMEDIALSKKLLKRSRPLRIKTRLLTSGRRWISHGVIKTIVLMWSMRLAYFLGVSPHRLARFYKPYYRPCTQETASS